jgi:hypothetical protein
MKDLLTATRIGTLQRCPRAHYWRFEVGLQTLTTGEALRFGSAWHQAMEARAKGADCQFALVAGIGGRSQVDELAVATLSGLLDGYYHQYTDTWSIAPEIEFAYPLRRGRGAMWAAGKIDGITDLALIEHKTTSSDISPGSDYWLRLRGNFQILQYVEGARRLGYDPRCVIYDVVRKPSIRVRQTETVEQFGDRLAVDCKDRPEFYFARREVPILEDDLARFREERNQLAAEIVWRRRVGAWPRSVSERTCQTCEFQGFCLQGAQANAEHVPAGFVVGAKHGELRNNAG